MQHIEAVGRGAAAKIVLFNQRSTIAAMGTFACNDGTINSAAYDDDIELRAL